MTQQSIPFTDKHRQLLHKTRFGEEQPGPIVRDFQTLLTFLETEGAQLTASGGLPLQSLEPLNERLVRSIQHGLKRPQQKSFPYINGLYLLLRVSGMTYVDATKKKPVLVFDDEVVASWQMLDATERYCALLETWLLHGDDEVLGERSTFAFQPPLWKWRDFFLYRLAQYDRRRIEADGQGNLADDFRYSPTPYHLALMDLFGFVRIEAAPPQSGSAWRISAVEHTPLGDAMLGLLTDAVLEDKLALDIFDSPAEILPGTLQPILQPYVPGWQRTLNIPVGEFHDGLYIFTVALTKDLWRRIAIPAVETLEELSDAILQAYSFDYDHLYQFIYPTRFGVNAKAYHPYMEEYPATTDVRIGDLALRPGATMLYNYDFGDNWYFEITLDRIDTPDPQQEGARLVDEKGEAPEQYPEW